jgi:hypothetical protein
MQKLHRTIKNDDINKVFDLPEYREASRLLREADPSSIEPPKDQLRSISLTPSSTLNDPKLITGKLGIVEDVANRRAGLLKAMGRYPEISNVNISQGRILLYAPDDNLADGAAVYPSKGFFDMNNVPPWDTWVCYVGRHLVSWVPPVLEELVTAGLEVNPEECILWSSPGFVNSLINPEGE